MEFENIKYRFTFFLLALFLSTDPSCAILQQDKVVDSLRLAIKKAKHDSVKVSAYISWADELFEFNRLDSAISVLNVALYTCDNAIEKKLGSEVEDSFLKKKANILIKKGAIYRKIGNPNAALEILNQSLELSQKIGYKSGVAWSKYQTGDIYDYSGNLNKALDLYFESLKIFQDINEGKGEGKVLNSIGTVYDYQGQLDIAMDYHKQALSVYKGINDLRGIADQLNNIGVIHHLKGDFINALEFYFQSAEINEKIISNRHVYAVTINNIGLIYDSMGDMLSALEYYHKSLNIFELLDFGSGIIMPLNNIGDGYLKQNDFSKAHEYYSRSLSICEQTNDEQGKAYTLQKICNAYLQQKDFTLADLFCNKCLNSYEMIGDKHGIAISLIAVGKLNEERNNVTKAKDYYNQSLNSYKIIGDKQGIAKSLYHIGSVLFKEGNYTDSYKYAYQAYSLAKEINDPNEISLSGNLLSNLHKKQGDFEKALVYYEEYLDILKNIESNEVNKLIQEQYYKHQYERRALADSVSFFQTIEITNLALEKKMEQTRRQKWVIHSFIVGLIVFLTFSILLLRLLVLKRIAYQKLEESNNEINQQKEEIISQRDEIESQRNLLQEKNSLLEQANAEVSAQRDLVISQKEQLEEVNLSITDSLRYAQSIQAALLPSEKIIESISPHYFILMKPYQVVSGDFFWGAAIDEFRIFCVADCTGHGVPGAFMSILGLNALNDIVVRHRIVQPDLILGHLRESVINALAQNDPDRLHKDGMDIALCTLNIKTRELFFSGAKLPIWIVVEDDLGRSQMEEKNVKSVVKFKSLVLYEVKADIMPVGIAPQMKPFNLNSFQLNNSHVRLYLASDGFIDQFGGKENTKYGALRLKNLILENSEQPFAMQKEIFETEFNAWIGKGKQVDDMTLMGIKI